MSSSIRRRPVIKVACGCMAWASVPVPFDDHFPFLSTMALGRARYWALRCVGMFAQIVAGVPELTHGVVPNVRSARHHVNEAPRQRAALRRESPPTGSPGSGWVSRLALAMHGDVAPHRPLNAPFTLGPPPTRVPAVMAPPIFKACDVRGTYPDQMEEEVAYWAGRGFPRVLSDP
jgi:hypothetical protein